MIQSEEEKQTINNKKQGLFPETDKIFQEMSAEIESKNEIPISKLQVIAAELEIPRFYNSVMVVKMPNFEKKLAMFRWEEEMKKLVDLLESEEFHELLRRNKLSTYIAADFKIRNSKTESIFSFIAARQDYDKNLVILTTTISTFPSF